MQAALINRPQPVTVQRAQSFIGHIVFASIVFLLCNPVFGLAAFILAGAMNYTVLALVINQSSNQYQHRYLCHRLDGLRRPINRRL